MTAETRAGQPVLAVLLILSTLAFGMGVMLEQPGDPPRVESSGSPAESSHGKGEHLEPASMETHENQDGAVQEKQQEFHLPSGEPGEGHPEGLILGLGPESPSAVWGAIVASLVLAMLAWHMKARWLTVMVVVFGLALAVLDFREVLGQLQRPSVILGFAVLAFLLHLAAAVVACGPVPWRRSLR